MCGILGIIAPPGEHVSVNQRALLAMRDTMQMRGPDSAGWFADRNVAFAHRRLAIRDREGGAQPWFSDDEQCVLVYNGEIYNDAALRKELAAQGHVFRSHCDTEVVMATYREWGTECVSRFRGMFAFGLYDFRNDSLFLARDRFGIKPLFLTQINNELAFASSIPALLAHPHMLKKPNLSVISHYLSTFRITLRRETMFEGVSQLLPGETLVSRGGQIQIDRYWNYPAVQEAETNDTTRDGQAAVQELNLLLRSVVQMRLASDVPVGMLMSGSVDSNVIAAMVRDTTSADMTGKCGGGDDGSSPDFLHARHCAEHLKFDYDEVHVGPGEYLDCWDRLLDQYATPVSTPSDVVILRLAEEMKRTVGVVLGGEGADELFHGYAVQHWAGQDFDRVTGLDDGTWNASAAGARIFRGSLQTQYGRDKFASLVDHYFALNSLIPTVAKPAVFRDWAWKAAEKDRRMFESYAESFAETPGESTSATYARFLHSANLEALLSRLDTATMAAGLEARVPYTDHELVERMWRLPQRIHIDVANDEQAPYLSSGALEARGSLRSKRVLRGLADRLLPNTLARRPKASFPTPVASWISGSWSDSARETLLNSPFGQEVFEPDFLQELADNLPQAGMWPWPVLNICRWGDRQFAA
jgi:asparagine synthase (glutamine-hydrolysing)